MDLTWADQLSGQTLALLGAGLAALLAVLLMAVAARRARRRTEERSAALARSLEQAEARSAQLAARLDRIEGQRTSSQAPGEPVSGVVRRPAGPASPDRSLDAWPGDAQPGGAPLAGRVEGRLFADIVAREATIKAAGVWHGLRVALTPENRNRIRWEMKQELKRSRRARREEIRTALRDLRARERAALAAETADPRSSDDEDAA